MHPALLTNLDQVCYSRRDAAWFATPLLLKVRLDTVPVQRGVPPTDAGKV